MDAGAPAEPASDPAAPFALMELFTSEGCNSCPPADQAINAIALAEQTSGRRVMVIAWHVDYWDYLGWKDPYASKYATDRQKLYAKAWICYLGMTAADGTFSMDISPAGQYAVDAYNGVSDKRSASRTVFSRSIQGDVALGDLFVVETGSGTDIAQVMDVSLDADLTLLAVDPGAIELPFPEKRMYAAGARVAAKAQPAYDTKGKKVLAMWALNPWGATSSKPIAVTLKNTFNLTSSDQPELRQVDDKGRLLPPIAMSVSQDEKTIATTSGGLDRLTWILLLR